MRRYGPMNDASTPSSSCSSRHNAPRGDSPSSTCPPMRSQADEGVFLAKSLGTRALAGIADRLARNRLASAIWLTPLFGVPEVRELAAGSGMRSLIVAGDVDPYHDPDGFQQVASALCASTLIVEHADLRSRSQAMSERASER